MYFVHPDYDVTFIPNYIAFMAEQVLNMKYLYCVHSALGSRDTFMQGACSVQALLQKQRAIMENHRHHCFCFQEAAHCRDNAKRRAADYLASESVAENIPEEEVFFLAITSYALSFSKNGHQSKTRLFQQMRNDCELILQFESSQSIFLCCTLFVSLCLSLCLCVSL